MRQRLFSIGAVLLVVETSAPVSARDKLGDDDIFEGKNYLFVGKYAAGADSRIQSRAQDEAERAIVWKLRKKGVTGTIDVTLEATHPWSAGEVRYDWRAIVQGERLIVGRIGIKSSTMTHKRWDDELGKKYFFFVGDFHVTPGDTTARALIARKSNILRRAGTRIASHWRDRRAARQRRSK